MPRHWLLKSEPDVFSIAHLRALPASTGPWDGVRNYQARNFLRDEMRPGDAVLFYHSSCPVPGVAGLAEVASAARPDPTQFDPASDYHDPKSDPANPRWWLVDVRWVRTFPEVLPLDRLRAEPRLAGLPVLRRGQRLSVQPVEPAHFAVVLELAGV